MKKQTGITLIALVITIIVLLILAGVSISMVVGNNGVLIQASTAVVKTKEATAREEVALAWSSVDSEYWTAWTDNSNVKKDDFFTVENLQKYLAGKGTVTSVDYATGTVVYVKDGEEYTFTIDANGNIVKSESETETETGTGTGTEEEKTYAIGDEIKLDGLTAVLIADNVDETTGYPIPNTLNYTTWNVIKQTEDTVTLLSQNALNPFYYTGSNNGNTYEFLTEYGFVNDANYSYYGMYDWFADYPYVSTPLSWYSSESGYEISVPTLSDLENIIEVSDLGNSDTIPYTLKDESYATWFYSNKSYNYIPIQVYIADDINFTYCYQSLLFGEMTLSSYSTPFICKPVTTISKSEIPDQAQFE